MAEQRRSKRKVEGGREKELERRMSIASIVSRVKTKEKLRRLSIGARGRLQQQAMRTASAMHELAQKAKMKILGPTADDATVDDEEDDRRDQQERPEERRVRQVVLHRLVRDRLGNALLRFRQ